MTSFLRSVLLASLFAFPPGALAGPADITPEQYQSMLKTGMDVDWLKTQRANADYSEQMVQDFKAAGVSHVRIRIRDEAGATLLAQLDQIITDCTKHGLIPVIAYQAQHFKQRPNEKTMAGAVAWWKTVAEHARNYPAQVSFDLIIEVSDALNNQPDMLNRFYEAAVTAIRKTHPNRIVFISPRVRSAPEYLNDLKIPSAHNNRLMAEWHFYASGPDRTNPAKLWTTGTKEERALIAAKIQAAKNWSERTGIKTWVGAWMPGNYNKGNDYTVAEQVAFARFVTCSLRAAGIPFSFNSESKFYDRKRTQWNADLKPVMDEVLKLAHCTQ